MLTALRIVDFAIIRDVELTLKPGFNILTGETGAGKSIIIGAANLLRGARASADMVRSGCTEAVVEAVFHLDRPEARQELERAGLGDGADELIVRRVVSATGRGRVYVNGSLCTAALLAKITASLLDICGQHDQQQLTDRGVQRVLLDELALEPKQLSEMGALYQALRDAQRRLADLDVDERTRAQRVDFLRYQLDELEAADLKADEEQELERERLRLQRASELYGVAAEGEQLLYLADDSVVGRVSAVQQRLETLRTVDQKLDPIAEQLHEARVLLEDVAQGLGRYATRIDRDPQQLDQLNERLELIYRLTRKHGCGLAELIVEGERMREELQGLEGHEEEMDHLQRRLSQLKEDAGNKAGELSASRQAAAHDLGVSVSRRLGELCMKGARFVVDVASDGGGESAESTDLSGRRIGPHGWDRIEFRVSANPGERPLSLARFASGGELSRVMLALRQVIGELDPVSTSIYDEVDTGIGGAVADVVGQALAEVAGYRQVLCVTHLPQVAAYADHHLLVGKGKEKGTVVRDLTEAERVEELARMLGGRKVTKQARANARQLIASATGKRRPS